MAREGSGGLAERIKQLVADQGLGHAERLPPERRFCEQLGVSRTDLRRALAEMEADGLIWRHVGRGTFIGARPVHNLDDVAFLGRLANAAQLIDARLAVEPELARLAALHAAGSDLEAMRTCCQRCRSAREWRSYEAWDSNFHHAVARATRNKLLLHFFDTLNAVRRSIVWGQLRATGRPADDHMSFAEHEAIFEAIAARDGPRAAAEMHAHLCSVRDRVLPAMGG
jgi:DNA-binding FadR family transcriptional regulator